MFTRKCKNRRHAHLLCLALTSVLQVCPAEPQKQPADKNKLCGVSLPTGLHPYKEAVEKKYGSIQCTSDNSGQSAASVNDNRAYIYISPADAHHLPVVAHEMMHLWLGTRGWIVSDEGFGHNFKPPLGATDQAAVDATYPLLEDYIEHRVFEPILEKNGVYASKEMEAIVKGDDVSMSKPGFKAYPTSIGAAYLQIKLADPAAAKLYEASLNRHGWGLALKAAELFEKTVNEANPETQTASYEAVQRCIDLAFSFSSPYRTMLFTHR